MTKTALNNPHSDYLVLRSETSPGISKEVVEHLDLGYVPIGGICILNDCGDNTYYQAVIKKKRLE